MLKKIFQSFCLLVFLTITITVVLYSVSLGGMLFGPYGALAAVLVVGAVLMGTIDKVAEYFDIF